MDNINAISPQRWKELYGNKKPQELEQLDEGKEQMLLFRWAEYQICKYPELELLHHIPNGGLRNIKVAKKLKAEGVKAGVPDICLPVPRAGYHGLYIEMKKQHGGQVSSNQKLWLNRLQEQGYLAKVCHGCDQAQELILKYLRAGVNHETDL